MGTITPASAGCMCSNSSWRLRKYQGAFDGLGVWPGFARSWSGELIRIESTVNVTVNSKAAMNSTNTRSGQTSTSSSR